MSNFENSEREKQLEKITLRDEVAMHAPISMDDAIGAYKAQNNAIPKYCDAMRFLAQMRYEYADAFLEARKR